MRNFWWEVFTENGYGSFSRVATSVVLFFLLVWDTYLVIVNKAVPNLADQALFLGVLYGVNKAANVVTQFSGPKEGNGKQLTPAPKT